MVLNFYHFFFLIKQKVIRKIVKIEKFCFFFVNLISLNNVNNCVPLAFIFAAYDTAQSESKKFTCVRFLNIRPKIKKNLFTKVHGKAMSYDFNELFSTPLWRTTNSRFPMLILVATVAKRNVSSSPFWRFDLHFSLKFISILLKFFYRFHCKFYHTLL